jgi:hypothetical protein
MNTFIFNQELPKIGESVNKFINHFGCPIDTEDSMLIRFDCNIKDSSYLCLVTSDDKVYHINWTLPLSIKEARNISEKFLPKDSKLISVKGEIKHKYINGDEPVTIYEYHSEKIKESNVQLPDQPNEGYITIYLSKTEKGTNFVVALGREMLV